MKSSAYQYIHNPLINEWVSLNSNSGINVINSYLHLLGGASMSEPETVNKPNTPEQEKTNLLPKNNILRKTLIILITDVGEEIDDEVTLSYLMKIAPKLNLDINVLFTDGNLTCEQRQERASLLCGSATYVSSVSLGLEHGVSSAEEKIEPRKPGTVWYGHINKIEDIHFSYKNAADYQNRIILQIGPISKIDKYLQEMCLNLNHIQDKKGYDYIILGDIGSTTNSNNKDTIQSAKILASKANNCFTIRTKHDGQTIIPPFTGRISSWPHFTPKLKNEILFLGLKNTLGRAVPLPFTVHLVGKGGSNYETLNSMVRDKFKIDLSNIFEIYSSTDDEAIEQSKTEANKYFDKAKSLPLWDGDGGKKFRESQLNIFNTTHEEQEEDLAKMLFAIHKLYDLAPKIYYSNQITLQNFQDEPEQFMGEDEYLNSVFTKHKELIDEYPNMPLTPAFDLVAGIACVYLSLENIDQHFILLESSTENFTLLDDEKNTVENNTFINKILKFKYMQPHAIEVFLNHAL